MALCSLNKQLVAGGKVKVTAETRNPLHTLPNPLYLADFPTLF